MNDLSVRLEQLPPRRVARFRAEGMAPENVVAAPAAWRAVVEGGRIKSWRIFTDHTRTVAVIKQDTERAAEARAL